MGVGVALDVAEDPDPDAERFFERRFDGAIELTTSGEEADGVELMPLEFLTLHS